MNIDQIKAIETVNEEAILDSTPYPQADNVLKLFSFATCLKNSLILDEEIMESLDITKRQVSYYGNALKYLGLVERRQGSFLLTKKGIKFANLTGKKKRVFFAEACLLIPTINATFIKRIESPTFNIKTIMKILKDSGLHISSEYTLKRRATTIKSWISFIESTLPIPRSDKKKINYKKADFRKWRHDTISTDNKEEVSQKYYVYVIGLKPEYSETKKAKRDNPNFNPKAANSRCYYVGYSSKTPEERYKQHIEGHISKKGFNLSSATVQKFGYKELGLRYKKFNKYNPINTKEKAMKVERELADRLRRKGHCVCQN